MLIVMNENYDYYHLFCEIDQFSYSQLPLITVTENSFLQS